MSHMDSVSQDFGLSSTTFPGHNQGAGREVEQTGHMGSWSMQGEDPNHCATTLGPVCYFDNQATNFQWLERIGIFLTSKPSISWKSKEGRSGPVIQRPGFLVSCASLLPLVSEVFVIRLLRGEGE